MVSQYIWCLNIYGVRVTTNDFTTNNMFFFVSDLKIVFYNDNQSSITMTWAAEKKYLRHY